MKVFIVLVLLCPLSAIRAIDMIYPVAVLPEGTASGLQLYLIHQKGRALELLLWDFKTGRASRALSSQFTPALLRLLADNSGFSFIDNGRLRIKKYDKRSPKALDFDDFLYGISCITWFDACNGYGSAKIRDRHVIFNVDVQGHITILVQDAAFDCFSPQKINSELFYIQRIIKAGSPYYSIVKTAYTSQSKDFFPLLDFGNKPLIFLTMISESAGFVIETPVCIDSTRPVIEFTCHYIARDTTGKWYHHKIVTFSIPTWLLIGEHSLYESIMPLLPRVIHDTIYYVDSSGQSNKLDMYGYNVITKQTVCHTQALPHHYYFSPYCIKDMLMYGGTVVTYNIADTVNVQQDPEYEITHPDYTYIYLPRLHLLTKS